MLFVGVFVFETSGVRVPRRADFEASLAERQEGLKGGNRHKMKMKKRKKKKKKKKLNDACCQKTKWK